VETVRCPLADVQLALRFASVAFRYHRSLGRKPASGCSWERRALAAGFPLDTTAVFRGRSDRSVA